jgi:hypothetical protein
MRRYRSKIPSVDPVQNVKRDFFSKDAKSNFFKKEQPVKSSFFKPMTDSGSGSEVVQRKCAECEKEENTIQRQEEPGQPEQKPSSPEEASSPLSRRPRLTKCNNDPRFPDFGCFGRQLKLDIDENLINNAHQFSRAATLFPGDNQLMLDTFLRYGLGKNLLDTSFQFAGFSKRASSILSYGTGALLKTYDLAANGTLKLDVQIPIGKNLNLDLKFDLDTGKDDPSKGTRTEGSVGISGSF